MAEYNLKRKTMLKQPEIRELCQGEIRDFILELVEKELRNIPADLHCRRRELCETILAYNRPVGNRTAVKQKVLGILKQWDAKKEHISSLESFGFNIVKGKTHYKMRWNNSTYCTSLSSSASDRRANLNSIQDATRTFF